MIEDAVGLAPEGDVAGGVAGDVDHLEAGDLVALVELAVDRVAGAGEDLAKNWAMKWSGWRSPIRSGFSAASASASRTQ